MQKLAEPHRPRFDRQRVAFEEYDSSTIFYRDFKPILEEASFVKDGIDQFFHSVSFTFLCKPPLGKALVTIQAAKEVPEDRRDRSLKLAKNPDDVNAFQVIIQSELTDNVLDNEVEVFIPSRMSFAVQSPFDPYLYLECIQTVYSELTSGNSISDARAALNDIFTHRNLAVFEFTK
jgi:hypothetical protein